MEKHTFRRIVFALLASLFFLIISDNAAAENKIRVYGDVMNELHLSIENLKDMPSLYVKDVDAIAEKNNCADKKEHQLTVDQYTGVLLRDVLDRAKMKHRVKWEPGVYVIVRGTNGEKTIFSFGEIFYSSIGRSILISYQTNGRAVTFEKGCGSLVVSTDIRCGRWIPEIKEIEVKRVSVELLAYEDKTKNIIRPGENTFAIIDHDSGKQVNVGIDFINTLPQLYVPEAVMTGDCEGFHGVFSFEGPSFRAVLEKFGIAGCPPAYNRYALVTSSDGFCATFSFGEIFNSRLSGNLVIAVKRDNQMLPEKEGFARTVAREDSTGGRSVKRISRIEIFTEK